MLEGDEYEDHLIGDPNQLDDLIEARDLNQLEGDDENDGDAGNEEQDDGDEKKEKPKRTRLLNPQPKLDAVRLTGPRGIAIVENLFRDFKFYGPGYEDQDLKRIMKRLELWGNRLFPKFQFDDLLEKVEKLGHKRPVLNFVNKIRMGIVTEDSVAENPREESDVMEVDEAPNLNGNSFSNNVGTDDAFDQLFGEHRSQTNIPQPQDNISPAKLQTTITNEQKERMMRNRLLAEERRLARIKAQEEKDLANSQSIVVPTIEMSSEIDKSTEMNEQNPEVLNSANGRGEEEPDKVEVEQIDVNEGHKTSLDVDAAVENVPEPSPLLRDAGIAHDDEKPEEVEEVMESHETCDVGDNVETVADLNVHHSSDAADVELKKVDQVIESNETCDKVDKTVLLEGSEPAGEKITQVSLEDEEMKLV